MFAAASLLDREWESPLHKILLSPLGHCRSDGGENEEAEGNEIDPRHPPSSKIQ